MKNFNSVFALCAACLALVSCGKTTRIIGTIEGASESRIVLNLLDINHYVPIDTLKTDASGHFRGSVKIRKGQPEFIYLFKGDRALGALLLERGDKAVVEADTLGRWSVSGSLQSEKLALVQKTQADFSRKFTAAQVRLSELPKGSKRAAELRAQVSEDYVKYYRSQLRYILENATSLTVVPILYENIAGVLPLFGQPTDAVYFRAVSDSLSRVWPESRYVRALEKEAARRENLLALGSRIESAGRIGYIDFELPGIDGQKQRLSELAAGHKVVMVYFWASEIAAQKMFNQDVLKPVHKQYKDKGFEIMAVSLDTDKALWASAVRHQELPWVNVCDGKGTASPVLPLYNVQSIPSLFFIVGGELKTAVGVKDGRTLRAFLDKNL